MLTLASRRTLSSATLGGPPEEALGAPLSMLGGSPRAGAAGPGVTLVVDDNADLRATLREMLEDMGHGVVEAQNGQEAFNFLVFNPTTPVRLIVLDLQMPVMSGWEFLELVQTYVRLARIPVVVASSFASTLGERQRRGVVACLQTPADLPHFKRVINDVVS